MSDNNGQDGDRSGDDTAVPGQGSAADEALKNAIESAHRFIIVEGAPSLSMTGESATLEASSRWQQGKDAPLIWAPLGLALLGLVLLAVALVQTDAFDTELKEVWKITTQEGSAQTRTVTVEHALPDLRLATAAMAVLLGTGWLMMCAGIGLAMSEASVVLAKTPPPGAIGTGPHLIADPTNVFSKLVTTLATAPKEIVDALRDLRGSTTAFVFGALLLLMGGAIGWQTISGAAPVPETGAGAPTSNTNADAAEGDTAKGDAAGNPSGASSEGAEAPGDRP